jgi:predicted RND superfamily exporter protein
MAGHSEQTAMPVVRDPKDFDRRSGNMLERAVFNNRLLVLLACLVATVVLGFAATRIEVNANFERMIPLGSPYIQNYLQYKNELPGLGNTVRIVVENRTGDIFDPDYLEVLRKVNDDLYLIPGVDRSWMKSIWMPVVRWREVTEDGITGGAVMPANFVSCPAEIAKLRANIG